MGKNLQMRKKWSLLRGRQFRSECCLGPKEARQDSMKGKVGEDTKCDGPGHGIWMLVRLSVMKEE